MENLSERRGFMSWACHGACGMLMDTGCHFLAVCPLRDGGDKRLYLFLFQLYSVDHRPACGPLRYSAQSWLKPQDASSCAYVGAPAVRGWILWIRPPLVSVSFVCLKCLSLTCLRIDAFPLYQMCICDAWHFRDLPLCLPV